jgi:hypothetical protein
VKAKIIEHRIMSLKECLRHPFNSFVTTWELEDGRKISIYTAIEGGTWTRLRVQDKLGSKLARLNAVVGFETDVPLDGNKATVEVPK